MTLNLLLKELTKIDRKFKQLWPNDTDKERTLARLAKTQEELGELSSEVLASMTFQRQSKMEKFDQSNLAKEWTDVLFSHILLAIFLDIDIEKSIDQRMKTIKKRYHIKP
jgi:NTP pyrophosphatase (non-canonical NTP hydrolase)